MIPLDIIFNIQNKDDFCELRNRYSKKELYYAYKNVLLLTDNKIYIKAMNSLGIKYKIKAIFTNIKWIIKKKKDSNNFNTKTKQLKQILQDYYEKILVVIPSDSIKDYENVGHKDRLSSYFNPNNFFDIVFLVSIFEKNLNNQIYKLSDNIYVIDSSPSQIKNFIKLINPNCVRAYGGYWSTQLATDNKINNIPVICSVHDKRENMIYNSILKADYIFSVSNAVTKILLKKGVEQSKILHLDDRVNLNYFYKKNLKDINVQYININTNLKYILFIGRMSAEKNLDTVIKSLSLLPKNYHLIAIGYGDNSHYIEIAKQYNVINQITWIKKIENYELLNYYSLADCFCVPSRSEGFGIVFIEAAACECPIVTSNIEPMNEYLKHLESALLVDDYENFKEIAKAILKICEDKNFSKAITKKAKQDIQRFNQKTIDEIEAKYYQQIIKK